MLGAMITAQGWELTHYLVTGNAPAPGGHGHHLLRTAWGAHETADGHIALAGLDPTKLAAIAEALGAPELARFAGLEPAERLKAAPEINAQLNAALKCHTTEAAYSALIALGVRCAKVQSYADVAADPQVEANGYIVEIDHPRFGRTRMTGNPLRFSHTPIELAATAPGIGEHTLEILRELELSDEEIALLMERRVVA
jgi:crotonobetainyl-CoA:carnitine CoA-transferase CaiB-like acyl-CoA transferase